MLAVIQKHLHLQQIWETQRNIAGLKNQRIHILNKNVKISKFSQINSFNTFPIFGNISMNKKSKGRQSTKTMSIKSTNYQKVNTIYN